MRCRSTVNRWNELRCGRLRTGAHSGSRRVHQAVLLERFDDRDERLARAEQPDERLVGLRRPRIARRRRRARVARARRAGTAPLDAPRPRPRAGSASRRSRSASARQVELAVAQHEAAPDLAVATSAAPLRARRATSSRAPTRRRPPRPPRGRPPRRRPSARRRRRAEPRRDVVLVLEQQPVGRAAGDPVQLDPHGQQQVRRGLRQPRAARSPARPAPSACSTRRSRRPPFACLRSGSSRWATSPSFAWRSRVISSSPASRFRAPSTQRSRTVGEHALAELDVTGDRAPVEQAQHDLQVVAGDRDRFLRRPHAVIERDAGVPDRVPEPVGDLAEVARDRRGSARGRGRSRARARGGRARRRR